MTFQRALLGLLLLIAISPAPELLAKGFRTATNYPSGEYPSAAAVRDLSNDQFADIVSANVNDGNLSVFLNNGDGNDLTLTVVP